MCEAPNKLPPYQSVSHASSVVIRRELPVRRFGCALIDPQVMAARGVQALMAQDLLDVTDGTAVK